MLFSIDFLRKVGDAIQDLIVDKYSNLQKMDTYTLTNSPGIWRCLCSKIQRVPTVNSFIDPSSLRRIEKHNPEKEIISSGVL